MNAVVSCGKMTLSGKADARLLLSVVVPSKPLVRSIYSCFFAACGVCEVRRRRVIKIKTMMRSVVPTDTENT